MPESASTSPYCMCRCIFSARRIFSASNWLQMEYRDAPRIPAQMVKNKPFWDVSYEYLIGNTMSEELFPPSVESSVTAVIKVSRPQDAPILPGGHLFNESLYKSLCYFHWGIKNTPVYAPRQKLRTGGKIENAQRGLCALDEQVCFSMGEALHIAILTNRRGGVKLAHRSPRYRATMA